MSILKTIGGLALGFFVMYVLFSTALTTGDASRKQPKAKATPTCVSDWTKCKDNEDLVNHWSGISRAQVDCKYETNDRAKYDTPKYTSFYFSSFQSGNSAIETGKLHVIDTDVKMQNGFGAWARTKVYCQYDLRNKKVLNISIVDR